MIELAPHNPYGLALRSPVIVAPGCAAPLRDLDPALIGAVATRTAVLHTPPEGRWRWASVPAGIVFEQIPPVRFRALLQAEAKRWRRSPAPVLLSLGGAPDDLAGMTARLEQIEGIAGVIIQSDAGIVQAVDAARSQTTLPLLTILGMQFGNVMAGAVVAETVFNWPGLGRLAFESVLRRDYPTILGILFVSSFVVVVMNLLTDIAYGLVDPRIRKS